MAVAKHIRDYTVVLVQEVLENMLFDIFLPNLFLEKQFQPYIGKPLISWFLPDSSTQTWILKADIQS